MDLLNGKYVVINYCILFFILYRPSENHIIQLSIIIFFSSTYFIICTYTGPSRPRAYIVYMKSNRDWDFAGPCVVVTKPLKRSQINDCRSTSRTVKS